jgi:cyclopropane-fatty-acyl-phospholipid synthase
MGRSFHLAPDNYVSPKNPIDRWLSEHICRLMISNARTAIATDSGNQNRNNAEFVLAPPRWWTALKMLIAPNLWVGESYAAGSWYLKKGSLTDFLEVTRAEAPPAFRNYFEFTAALRGFRYYLSQYILNKWYTRKVRKHYEIDSTIYEAILDNEMIYTCAFFDNAAQDLESAQQAKLSLAISRLGLPSGPAKVLDIGCGWGATARAIVRQNPNAEVCGLSISRSQIDWATARDSATLTMDQQRRIKYRVEDYVDHGAERAYDAIIVIGMIEHVGLGGYPTFFRNVHSFLKPGGTGVIHTIVSPTPAEPGNRWIDKHIFTGGYAPSISELVKAIEVQRFQITALHLHRPENYRRTIQCWLENFVANENIIAHHLRSEGESEPEIVRFIRIWHFYLSAVRNMFSDTNLRSHQVVQACIKKR